MLTGRPPTEINTESKNMKRDRLQLAKEYERVARGDLEKIAVKKKRIATERKRYHSNQEKSPEINKYPPQQIDAHD